MQTFEYDRKQSKRIETNLSSDHRESKAAGRLEKTQKKEKESPLIEHSSAPLVHYSGRWDGGVSRHRQIGNLVVGNRNRMAGGRRGLIEVDRFSLQISPYPTKSARRPRFSSISSPFLRRTYKFFVVPPPTPPRTNSKLISATGPPPLERGGSAPPGDLSS